MTAVHIFHLTDVHGRIDPPPASHNRYLGPNSVPYGKSGFYAQALGLVSFEVGEGVATFTEAHLIPLAIDETVSTAVGMAFESRNATSVARGASWTF